ncbi:hypothetical protein Tco_0649793 [Tanacetum coccineum]
MTGNITHLLDFKDLMEVMLLLVEEHMEAELLEKNCGTDADDGFQDEMMLQKSHDDSSLKDNAIANQQVNTSRPEINTGSREVSTALPEVNTATPEDLVGPSPASEDI